MSQKYWSNGWYARQVSTPVFSGPLLSLISVMQSFLEGDTKMTQTATARLRTPFQRNHLLNLNQQLQAEVAALVEDNKQLRAALSIYSEVARRSSACLRSVA